MQGVEAVHEPNNKAITRRMFSLLIITCIPLLIALVINLNNPDSELLRSISAATSDLPALLSSQNLFLSSVLNAWCKTAPLWALVLVLLSINEFQIKKDQDKGMMIKALIAFSVFYFVIIYMLLLHSAEITESGRLVRAMSQNDYLLTFLFVAVYAACFILTTYYLLFIAAVCKTFGAK
ncbi:colicin immunity protein Cui [Superficieibacter sp.]|uniref:colicin immunity protein Cui n=1 Tax=Superficieibacter sp. TaxID=2303322 RepID=UPI0028A9A428|nr:colicin immunity protein Cui [Superficieibacter sp.]